MTNTSMSARPSRRDERRDWYAAALSRQAESGLSVAAFAKDIGVTPATLYQWKRRLASAREGPSKCDAPSGLVRVRAVGPDGNHRASRSPLIVRLESGHTLEIPFGFDAAEVSRLAAVLGSC